MDAAELGRRGEHAAAKPNRVSLHRMRNNLDLDLGGRGGGLLLELRHVGGHARLHAVAQVLLQAAAAFARAGDVDRRATLERAMHRAGVTHEVRSRPRMAREEIERLYAGSPQHPVTQALAQRMGLQDDVFRLPVREAFAPAGVLSRAADQFRPRPQQTEMALAVARTIETGGALVVEAATPVTFTRLCPRYGSTS